MKNTNIITADTELQEVLQHCQYAYQNTLHADEWHTFDTKLELETSLLNLDWDELERFAEWFEADDDTVKIVEHWVATRAATVFTYTDTDGRVRMCLNDADLRNHLAKNPYALAVINANDAEIIAKCVKYLSTQYISKLADYFGECVRRDADGYTEIRSISGKAECLKELVNRAENNQ